MFPSSRLGSQRLRNRDPFMGKDNMRDIFGEESSPLGSYRTRLGGMGSRNNFDEFPRSSAFRERFTGADSPFNMDTSRAWADDDDFMRKSRENSPFFSRNSTGSSPPPDGQSDEASGGGRRSNFFHRDSMPNRPESRERMSPRSFSKRYFSFDTEDEAPSDGRQSKVHHIPIQVEPRDNNETHQNYNAERGKSPEQQHAPTQQRQFNSTPVNQHYKQQSPPPTNQYFPTTTAGSQYQQSKPQTPASSTSQYQQRNPPPPPKTKNFNQEIPLKVERDISEPMMPSAESENLQENADVPDIKSSKPAKPTTLTILSNMKEATKEMEANVYEFKGVKGDKEYLYLDEMLTRILIKLDDIDAEGNDEIRMLRKNAVKDVSRLIQVLENTATMGNDSCQTGEPSVSEEKICDTSVGKNMVSEVFMEISPSTTDEKKDANVESSEKEKMEVSEAVIILNQENQHEQGNEEVQKMEFENEEENTEERSDNEVVKLGETIEKIKNEQENTEQQTNNEEKKVEIQLENEEQQVEIQLGNEEQKVEIQLENEEEKVEQQDEEKNPINVEDKMCEYSKIAETVDEPTSNEDKMDVAINTIVPAMQGEDNGELACVTPSENHTGQIIHQDDCVQSMMDANAKVVSSEM